MTRHFFGMLPTVVVLTACGAVTTYLVVIPAQAGIQGILAAR